ncbi:MAG: hypothetical protein AAF609_27275, partial [Cyanobacteria bacterium P01_C01_bin.120]
MVRARPRKSRWDGLTRVFSGGVLMQFLLRLSGWIDRISRWIGWFTIGLTLIMTAVGAYNAITR